MIKILKGSKITPVLLEIITDSAKRIKVESWTAQQIVLRYPLIGNWKITLDAKKILGKGKLFPVSASGEIPDRIIVRVWFAKFTILSEDIQDYLIEAGLL